MPAVKASSLMAALIRRSRANYWVASATAKACFHSRAGLKPRQILSLVKKGPSGHDQSLNATAGIGRVIRHAFKRISYLPFLSPKASLSIFIWSNQSNQKHRSWARLRTALSCFNRALANPDFCRQATELLRPSQPQARPKPVELPPERVHASGLAVLSMLQREGRLIDFLKEDMAAFSDAEIGAAARVVHAGCRKVFSEYFAIEPALTDAEGATIQVPAGFDAQRIRLTGNIAGQPPFRGTLKHHGWVATAVRMPAVSETLDPRVLAAAEVEL